MTEIIWLSDHPLWLLLAAFAVAALMIVLDPWLTAFAEKCDMVLFGGDE